MATAADRDAVTAAAPTRVITPPRPAGPPDLVRAVEALQAAFRAAALPLDLANVGALRAERARVIEQGDDYLLPRLQRLQAPALVVVGGPTGAGKSTLVNSLVGRKVTTPGLLRPTTRSPVLVHHPSDRDWFGPDRLLPSLDRVEEPTSDQGAIQLVPAATVPRGLAILDAPDFDSIDGRNRELATKLLAAADVLLFVTSAARYSDQVPWQQLTLALERETAVAVVMNRIPADDAPTVSPDLIRMLRPQGVGADRVFFVGHEAVDESGRLPAAAVGEVRAWLDALAADVGARSALVEQTVRGAARRAITVADPVADAAGRQVEAVSGLLAVADRVYGDLAGSLRSAIGDGTVMRGELLAQWAAFVGQQDVPPLAAVTAALRARSGVPEPELRSEVDRVGLALDLALETLVVDHAQRAASRAARELAAGEHGRALLDWSDEDLSRPGRGLATRARRAIAGARQRLAAAVAAQTAQTAQAAQTTQTAQTDQTGAAGSAAARAIAVALVVRSLSGGDREADLPADLPADLVVRRLAESARTDVVRTVTGLLAEERDRYLRPVLDWNLAPDAPRRLRMAASEAERALAVHRLRWART